MTTPVSILGASGHAKVVIAAAKSRGWAVVAAYDDDRSLIGTVILGVPVIGTVGDWLELRPCPAIIAMGNNAIRKRIATSIKDEDCSIILHSSAWVAETATVGCGSVIFAGAVVQPDAKIGRHVILNTGASVDHDCRINDCVHLAPGVRLAGGVIVDEGAFIGIGAVVVPGVHIGAWATVGAGAAVIGDVPQNATVVGVPARSRGK